MENLFERIKWCNTHSLEKTIFERLACVVEEVGEVSKCLLVDNGNKKRDLKESSKEEATDVVVAALALYYATGGTHTELMEIMDRKVTRWTDLLKRTKLKVEINNRVKFVKDIFIPGSQLVSVGDKGVITKTGDDTYCVVRIKNGLEIITEFSEIEVVDE